jgi:hypothetical protein
LELGHNLAISTDADPVPAPISQTICLLSRDNYPRMLMQLSCFVINPGLSLKVENKLSGRPNKGKSLRSISKKLFKGFCQITTILREANISGLFPAKELAGNKPVFFQYNILYFYKLKINNNKINLN